MPEGGSTAITVQAVFGEALEDARELPREQRAVAKAILAHAMVMEIGLQKVAEGLGWNPNPPPQEEPGDE